MNHAAGQTRHHGFDMFWLHRAKHCDRTNSQNLLMPGHLPVGFLSPKCFKISRHPTSFHFCMRWSDRKKLAFGERIGCWRILFARVWFGGVPWCPKAVQKHWFPSKDQAIPEAPVVCTVGHTALGSRFVSLNCGCSPRFILISHPIENDKHNLSCAPMRQVFYKHASSPGKWVSLA